MKVFAISDNRLPQLNDGEFLRRQYGDASVLVSCGDLDADYVDFIASVLSLPLYYVRGNHDHRYTDDKPGGINLHRRIETFRGYTLLGLEGSIRYNKADIQYTDSAMLGNVLRLLPGLLMRRALKEYGVDLVVAHSPPKNINDGKDWAHRGFNAFRLLIRWAQPRYFIHGHVDLYDRRASRETQFLKTQVININPKMVIDLGNKEATEKG